MELFCIGFTASLLAGLATGAGALLMILVKRVPDSVLDGEAPIVSQLIF
ncbi:hypothetical protein KEJ34_01340 [Candidatus Bathyarchaeota archaeon]|nr:hypothetical protein [Candidatus Bathyarchaeota archaeon]